MPTPLHTFGLPSGVRELLIVADVSDKFVQYFADYASSAGWSVTQWTYTEAARHFSVARHTHRVTVTPTAPLFLRLPTAIPAWSQPEAQFHRAEICSLIWAAAALSPTLVINRPTAHGLVGRCTSTASALRHRASQPVQVEIYASALPSPQGPAEEWWVEPHLSRSPLPWTPQDIRKGPFRAGQVRPGFQLHTIIVVGQSAVPDSHFGPNSALDARSADVCRTLELIFASVTWRHYPDTGESILVRVNPQPSLTEIGDHTRQVASCLLAAFAA